ncbi:MAG TPA: hypothetical protein VMR77_00995 [Patescibacteria group bacterium]|jgi:hypothetical protein|nr:hypothetical protein [Patescibacteria group bacterium]
MPRHNEHTAGHCSFPSVARVEIAGELSRVALEAYENGDPDGLPDQEPVISAPRVLGSSRRSSKGRKEEIGRYLGDFSRQPQE